MRKCRSRKCASDRADHKSELVSHRFPAFMLGRDPELRLISASHTADLAVSMNRDVQRIMTREAYAALYQQNPADASAAEWAPELFGDWMWVPPEHWPREFDPRVVCVDASKGRSDKQRDYSAIVFMGIHAGLLYIDAIVQRIPLDQIVRKTLVFCDEKRPNLVGIEGEQFQELLVHEFRRQCGEDFAVRWPIYTMLTQGVPKIARIRRLNQYVINRELRFKADSPGCRLLVDQLLDFPLADHDDGPAALEMCVRLPFDVYRCGMKDDCDILV